MQFNQVTNLNNHMKSHHKIQQYVCNQCPRRFTQVTSLNQHLLLHSGFSGLVCPQCPDKTFKQQNQLQQHMKTHGLSFPFECAKCDEKFLQAAHFNQHLQLHEEFKFRCSMCSSSFNSEALLKKHTQRHIDGRYHQCPECSKGFTLKNQLNKHIQLEHASSEVARLLNKKRTSTIAGKFNCYFDNCDAFFDTNDLLNTHLNNIHGLALIKSQNAGTSNTGNSGNSGGRSKKNKEHNNIIKEEEQHHQGQVQLSLPLGISLPPFNPLNGHGLLQAQHHMTAPQQMNVMLQNAHQQVQQVIIQQSQQHHHHQQQQQNHAINISNKEKNKCHECNIMYSNETDYKVHMYYKHYNANKM